MQCPKCQFENREGANFCKKCGDKLELKCPSCGCLYQSDSIFCDGCGYALKKNKGILPGSDSETILLLNKKVASPPLEFEGERKYVTVLFSDMSGYTSMSERLDPEEVKEISGRIFGEISQVIAKYDGFIEKYVGDAVMALFGVPISQEDDPVRAIKAAREIHCLVANLSPKYQSKISQPLTMHTGINTGLVVTGEINLERGTHGVAGDTINLAARLSGLALPNEILVAPDTCRLTEGYFVLEELEPTMIKGKKEPVQAYKVISPKAIPRKVHRLHGLRADLIGRKTEIDQLKEGVDRLRQGKGGIVSICGDAGTGKSRLMEEFKSTLDIEEIQWREGHAYAYSQNSPYATVIDLLNRAFQIEEGDSPEKLREKVESGIKYLAGETDGIVPYIGSLFSLRYPEVEDVSPEFWKVRLQEGMNTILAAFAQEAPTIICLEDLHWADPSSVDLIRFVLAKSGHPALFVCVYRPTFNLFTSQQLATIGESYSEIRLQDLSPSETQDMAASLLKSESIPAELRKFIQKKIGGNPFYMEEALNSLVEAGTLVRHNQGWKLTKSISDADIPSTIQGVLAARLDRLGKETRRILQEASVIGRTFFYEILKKITDLKDQIDESLHKLERLDLIRTKSFEGDLEYIFKHALTQDAVYNGLLKKERQTIHERIGQAMEQLFHDRLVEFYEILAYHFSRGQSLLKAVSYLSKSGEKSLRRFALEEAHNYYQEAFTLLNNQAEKSEAEDDFMMEVILKWALVFNHRGDFKGLNDLLTPYEDKAQTLNDKSKLGMFYAWLGFAILVKGKPMDGYGYLIKALNLGEEIGDNEVLGYACTWLGWACWDLGLLQEGIAFGERAQDIHKKFFKGNHYLHFSSLGAIGHICFTTGDAKRAFESADAHLYYGQRHSSVRSKVFGHIDMACGHFVSGNFPSAIESSKRAVQISPDPFFITYARLWLGVSYLLINHVQEAEEELQEVLTFSRTYGTGIFEFMTLAFLGVIFISKGQLREGLKMIEDAIREHMKEGRKSLYAVLEGVLGKVYLQIIQGEEPKSLSFMLKNIGFLAKNIPFAAKRAEEHLNKSMKVSREIGANSPLALALMDLGALHSEKKRVRKAQECISEAIQIFEQCGAEVYLKQAKKTFESLQ
jgi:class 3 adenylate cyclase/tetratricopeptide (TPR) repeat protein